MFFLLRYPVCRPPDDRHFCVVNKKFPICIHEIHSKDGYGAMSLLLNPISSINCQLSNATDIRFAGDVNHDFVLFWHIELLQ